MKAQIQFVGVPFRPKHFLLNLKTQKLGIKGFGFLIIAADDGDVMDFFEF